MATIFISLFVYFPSIFIQTLVNTFFLIPPLKEKVPYSTLCPLPFDMFYPRDLSTSVHRRLPHSFFIAAVSYCVDIP